MFATAHFLFKDEVLYSNSYLTIGPEKKFECLNCAYIFDPEFLNPNSCVMNVFKKVSGFLMAAVMVVSLTAAFPSSKVSEPVAVATEAPAVGKVSYKQMKAMATNVKGSKLTMKEKIALKVFGKKIATKGSAPAAEGKSQVIALILVALLGGLGIHRFYLGYTWQGVVQLLTLGGCGVWALIDLVRIIMGTLKPNGSEYATTL